MARYSKVDMSGGDEEQSSDEKLKRLHDDLDKLEDERAMLIRKAKQGTDYIPDKEEINPINESKSFISKNISESPSKEKVAYVPVILDEATIKRMIYEDHLLLLELHGELIKKKTN